MNKLLLTILIIIGFCQCKNNENSSLSDDQPKDQLDKSIDKTIKNYVREEDKVIKRYHVDTLKKPIPTRLIQDQYDGFIVGDNVRLRAKADAKSDLITELSNGLLLNVLSRTDKEFVLINNNDNDVCNEFGHPWVEVETIDGQIGWVFGKFVYKVENIEYDKINEFQGKTFEFDQEKYRFGYAIDFSHPAMDDDGLSGCDDLGMLFFYKEGERQIRPIIVENSQQETTLSLEQNQKGFWHFIHGSDGYVVHLYEAKTMKNKINFRYHACTQDVPVDAVIQVRFQEGNFYAKYIEYDDHQGHGSYFSEISDAKNSLFQYFEARTEIGQLNVDSEYHDDGLPLQINGGGRHYHKGKSIPTQLINDFDLYHLEIDQDPILTKEYGLGKADAIVRGHYRWTYKNYDLLLYSVTIDNKTSIAANDVRLLIIDHDGTIIKNIFIAGCITDDGENSVSRSITLQPNQIELRIEGGDNIPKYLKLKPLEVLKF